MTKTTTTKREVLFKIDATPDPALSADDADHGVTGSANIKFCGRPEYDRGKHKILKPNDPIERFNFEGETIALPPGDFQKRRRLFYHLRAADIASLFPHLYKLVRERRSK